MYNLNIDGVKNKKLILLGETHGVKENIEVIKEFVYFLEKKGVPVTVALEWPLDINSEIQSFFNNDVELKWQNWNFVKDKDGRISKEHIEFLQWLKKRNNKLLPDKRHGVYCFSVIDKSWNNRDLRMAKNIQSISKAGVKVAILAVMGSLHASKEKMLIEGEVHDPLASHLPKESFISFRFIYKSGTFFNHELQTFKNSAGSEGNDISIEPSTTKGYDYNIVIPHAHAITLLPEA